MTSTSYHDNTGANIINTTALANNEIYVLPLGSSTQNLAAGIPPGEHIRVVYVKVEIDFSLVTVKPASLIIETFIGIELPQDTTTVKMGNGNDTVVITSLGLDGITS